MIIKNLNFVSPYQTSQLSKARVYGRSRAGIAGSITAEVMDVAVLWVLCVAR